MSFHYWLGKIPKLVNSEIFIIEVSGAKILPLASLEVSYYPVYYHLPKFCASYSTFFCYLPITDKLHFLLLLLLHSTDKHQQSSVGTSN